MFKVFNHCLTTRTYEHDQTKINILQLFHVVVNCTNVDYVALLWWDFMNRNYPSIPQRLDEDYHFIKDDILLLSVYSTRNVLFRGMRIPNAFLTDEIRATDDYKEYETVFVGVEVLMNQRQLVVSTQGTHITTPKAHMTPTLCAFSPQGKKRKQGARKTIQEKLSEEEIEKMVEGEEDKESYAVKFANSMFNDDDDFGSRIEPRSYKKNLEVVVDDDDVTKNKDDKKDENEVKEDDVEKPDDAVDKKDNDDHTDHTLVKTHAMGSMETRNEQMQTPIPIQTRSLGKIYLWTKQFLKN
nr:hypothetical protein [Tanacetum cinerariifolium]